MTSAHFSRLTVRPSKFDKGVFKEVAAKQLRITAATTALRLLIGSVETRFENS